ncbi:hypothetical protein BGX23_004112 [Mortierella sp. AD031]|nr:hypothetical protein BGX23_004112 [Mortierella sp. AD031]
MSLTTTAKPISTFSTNHNDQKTMYQNTVDTSTIQNNVLNRLSSSWSSLTSPLRTLHVLSGSLGPAPPVSAVNSPKKRQLQKRGLDDKAATAATAARPKKKPVADKAVAKAGHTYSAYEAIVNSDSQMPIFLNQHHPKSSGNKGKSKGNWNETPATAATTGAGRQSVKKAVMVTPIDILRQTGIKKPIAAPVAAVVPAAEAEASSIDTSAPATSNFNSNEEDEEEEERTRDAPLVVEDGSSTVKTLFDTVFKLDDQQPQQQPFRRASDRSQISKDGSGEEVKRREDSEDIKAIKESINAAAHAAVAAAAAAAAASTGSSAHTPHLEDRDTAGILKQALENIAHKIEVVATAAIALEIPSLIDHHQETIVDDEGAVDPVQLVDTTNNDINIADTSEKPAVKKGIIIVNDNEYPHDDDSTDSFTYPNFPEHPPSSSEHTDDRDEWGLSDDADYNYMAQYVHRPPDNTFPGSESILFTGTVLQRTLASSALLLAGFLSFLGLISYKMYARRRNTSPWAFLHYMTFGVFSSLFYDSATLSNSTLNAYTTDSQDSPSVVSNSTMKHKNWLRRSSLSRASSTTSNSIMSSPAEKEPLLPEPVVASSSSASSSFQKTGPYRSELRRTSTAQHHQMQIELALQQQQQRQHQQQHQHQQQQNQYQQQDEPDYLQKSFMRRTSI